MTYSRFIMVYFAEVLRIVLWDATLFYFTFFGDNANNGGKPINIYILRISFGLIDWVQIMSSWCLVDSGDRYQLDTYMYVCAPGIYTYVRPLLVYVPAGMYSAPHIGRPATSDALVRAGRASPGGEIRLVAAAYHVS